MRRDIRRRHRGVIRFADNIHRFRTVVHLHNGITRIPCELTNFI
ncbi:Uncharacterised protein [Enterobacter cloacae]|nr:Uncharacterised protein [Enterobacter cloacae]